MLQRAKRDGAIATEFSSEPGEDMAIFKSGGPLAIGDQIVLEEYCLSQAGEYSEALAKEIADLVPNDALFQSVTERLVILSNGMMSHFATTTCEVAQHVRISDETGTADPGGLFNQENVPADTLFYSLISATKSRVPHADYSGKSADDALDEFTSKVAKENVFQFGGDASTGLGFASVSTKPTKEA